MEKILIVMLTHDKYVGLIPKVWGSLLEVEIPTGFEADAIIVAEDDNPKCIEYCQDNNLPVRIFNTDYRKLGEYLTNPKWKSPTTYRTFLECFKISEIRNRYLELGEQGDYDWILLCDGDVVPPKDGLEIFIDSGKKYIGAAVNSIKRKNKLEGYYVTPWIKDAEKPYKVSIMGNCFHLEHKDVFKIRYIMPDLRPICSDAPTRCGDAIKAGFDIWCDPTVICQHLDSENDV